MSSRILRSMVYGAREYITKNMAQTPEKPEHLSTKPFEDVQEATAQQTGFFF